MRDGRETRAPVKAHPHSAVSQCCEVWSPAPPPSARTGSGRSGTARTLWTEAKWSSPPSAPARRTGRLPTAPTLQHLPLAHGAAACVGSSRRDPSTSLGTALCTHTLGQQARTGTKPSPPATVGPCRDVTVVAGVAEGGPDIPVLLVARIRRLSLPCWRCAGPGKLPGGLGLCRPIL